MFLQRGNLPIYALFTAVLTIIRFFVGSRSSLYQSIEYLQLERQGIAITNDIRHINTIPVSRTKHPVLLLPVPAFSAQTPQSRSLAPF